MAVPRFSVYLNQGARWTLGRRLTCRRKKLLSIDETIQLIRIGEQTGSGKAAQTTCSADLVESPWVFDERTPGYGPGASMADVLPGNSPRQGMIPQEYKQASKEELDL